MKKVACIVLGLALIAGCNSEKSDEKIREVSNIQGQEAARNAIAAERDYVDSKARAAEADLEKRQRFYQALSGTYEGAILVNRSNFKIRLTLTPSLPRYVPSDRVRTWEEVTADLTNLYFNVQVVQWNPESSFSAVGCLVANVRPDIIKGKINIASEGCPNFYSFQISEEAASEVETNPRLASTLAEEIADGRLESVSQVRGKMQPTSNANIYTFSASRVEE
ncbi:MAG: hypothetical protein A2X86_06250 [Bdellovibrionales bacterium GWA2_49_15]|nr:MAG: hypothetical protein A2X86_06250 [Bdellovibrionales bacterium GWA2_49_15]HAZ14664.1 hypothetical protein [Bdellovibrionales bacterium]